jgi:hypothetical protein
VAKQPQIQAVARGKLRMFINVRHLDNLHSPSSNRLELLLGILPMPTTLIAIGKGEA